MKIPFVDLRAQYLSMKSEIDSAIFDVINNTAFIGGIHVEKFKENFEKLYGVKHCVPLGNGTDALYIAMKMMGIGEGDEVITTASSWISTSETITQTGAKPIFVDIDKYYTIDSSQIEEKITSRTKAIIPVHLYGQMADMPTIRNIAKKYNLRLIEDCAQSHFSELEGIKAGLWGDCGTFSFYPGKNLGAYGDAGCLITNDEDLALKCRRFANHGSLRKHHHEVEGINSRLDGLQAAILNVKLSRILQWTDKRREIAETYSRNLDGIKGIELPKVRDASKHSYHVYGIKVKDRKTLKEFLATYGISTQIHYPKAMPFMEAYAWLQAKPEDFPMAYELQNEELSLPMFPELTQQQIEYVCEKIIQFYNEKG